MSKTVLPVQDGRYQITANDVGVYLSVWGPGGEGSPVSKGAVIRELTERNFSDFDPEFIATVIREALGKPVQIMNWQSAIDGHYEIKANDTGVYLSVWGPAGAGSPVSRAEVIRDLTERNCVNFDPDFIAVILREAIGKPVQIINFLPAIDGRYEIIANDSGVYLSVWGPANEGAPVSKAAIIKDLMERKCTNFDSEFLSVVIREAIGSPVQIINSTAPMPPQQNIRVAISLDRMEARVSVSLSPEAPFLTMMQILDELVAAGVTYGIEEVPLHTLTQTRSAKNMICARGTLSCPGEDARLNYIIDPESQGRPEELEDGRVDYKETHTFLCVEEGQLLVEKIPATAGIPGKDVMGCPIPPRRGKDRPLPVGKNVIAADEFHLHAAINGHLRFFHMKRMDVIPVIVIEGDVDYSTGNIDFKGSVMVKGSIQADFSVKAGGNVEVCGNISGGFVEANSIIVHKGIQGMKRSVIKARERLVCKFIENATVYADQDIIVNDVILNSTIIAGSRVLVEGGRGLVRGGRISAGELVRAVTVGNPSGVVTEIDVSINSLLKDELLMLRQELKKADAAYEEAQRNLSYFQKLGVDRLAGEKLDRFKKIESDCKLLPDSIEDMKQRISAIEETVEAQKPGRIRVSGHAYPGTKLAIGTLNRVLNSPMQFVSFYVQNHELKFTSLK